MTVYIPSNAHTAAYTIPLSAVDFTADSRRLHTCPVGIQLANKSPKLAWMYQKEPLKGLLAHQKPFPRPSESKPDTDTSFDTEE